MPVPAFRLFRPSFRRACVGLAVALLAAAPGGAAAEATGARRPNIVFFLVDDLGWMDLGVQGSRYYRTPHIDAFAQRAVRFTDAYAQPLCSPTRASLLTGKYSARHGITTASGHQPPQPAGHVFRPATAPAQRPLLAPESKNYLEPDEITLAEALRGAGYRTGHFGKWHLGLTEPHWPERQGFDVAFHCHPDPGPPGNYFSPYGVIPTGTPRGQQRVGTITDGPPGEYIVDRVTDEALRFIEANRDRPFFVNLWHYGVHGPWGHKEAYTREFAATQDPTGRQGNPIMASMIRSIDESFGRVVAALDRLGLRDNTIVVFNSDNGGNVHSNVPATAKTAKAEAKKSDRLGDWRKWAGDRPPTNNTPLRDGKGSLHEGGVRVPLLWAWPGRIPAGGTRGDVVGHIDLYPTLLELTGVPRPAAQRMDGVSYAAVLTAGAALGRKAFFNYFPHQEHGGGVTVRAGGWKLIRWFDPRVPRELYDLQADLGETTNLASAQPGRVRDLDALIDGFLRDTGALVPLPNPAYRAGAETPAPRGRVAAAPVAAGPTTAPRPAGKAAQVGGWLPRAMTAGVHDGALHLEPSGNNAFIAVAGLQLGGPVTVRLRTRGAGGAGRIEWRTVGQDAFPGAGQTAALALPAAPAWAETRVVLPVAGALQHIRIYLPPGGEIAVDWIELAPAAGAARRWEFDAP